MNEQLLKEICDEILLQKELIQVLYLYINLQKKEIEELKW